MTLHPRPHLDLHLYYLRIKNCARHNHRRHTLLHTYLPIYLPTTSHHNTFSPCLLRSVLQTNAHHQPNIVTTDLTNPSTLDLVLIWRLLGFNLSRFVLHHLRQNCQNALRGYMALSRHWTSLCALLVATLLQYHLLQTNRLTKIQFTVRRDRRWCCRKGMSFVLSYSVTPTLHILHEAPTVASHLLDSLLIFVLRHVCSSPTPRMPSQASTSPQCTSNRLRRIPTPSCIYRGHQIRWHSVRRDSRYEQMMSRPPLTVYLFQLRQLLCECYGRWKAN